MSVVWVAMAGSVARSSRIDPDSAAQVHGSA
jgi:hypothetical protein